MGTGADGLLCPRAGKISAYLRNSVAAQFVLSLTAIGMTTMLAVLA